MPRYVSKTNMYAKSGLRHSQRTGKKKKDKHRRKRALKRGGIPRGNQLAGGDHIVQAKRILSEKNFMRDERILSEALLKQSFLSRKATQLEKSEEDSNVCQIILREPRFRENEKKPRNPSKAIRASALRMRWSWFGRGGKAVKTGLKKRGGGFRNREIAEFGPGSSSSSILAREKK